MLEFIALNWEVIVYVLAVLAVVVIAIVGFVKLPKSLKSKRIQAWLLTAVTEAEKSMGDGTGELKLLNVYEKFTSRYPVISLFITFDNFKKIVDNSLKQMRELMEQNEKIEEYIYQPEHVVIDDGESVECAYCGQAIYALDEFNGEQTCESCYQYLKEEMN